MIFDKLLKPNVLYYPGCLTKHVYKNLMKNYEDVLRRIGIKFIDIEELVCCGSPVKNAGYVQQFKVLVRKNFEILRKYNVGKIIFNCPGCYYTFKFEYPKIVKEWNLSCEHITQTICKAIDEGKVKLYKKGKGKVTYHDPCYLGRYCGVYEEPRRIIKWLGYDLVEMEENREKAFCCGGGGGVRANYLPLSKQISSERIEQALRTKAKILVSTCPLCVASLAEENRIKVLDISELILKHIR